MSVVEGDLSATLSPLEFIGINMGNKKRSKPYKTKQNKTLLHCVIVTHRLYSGGAEQLLAKCLGLKTDPVSVTYSVC